MTHVMDGSRRDFLLDKIFCNSEWPKLRCKSDYIAKGVVDTVVQFPIRGEGRMQGQEQAINHFYCNWPDPTASIVYHRFITFPFYIPLSNRTSTNQWFIYLVIDLEIWHL